MLAEAALARGLYRVGRARLARSEECDSGSLALRAAYQTLPFVPLDHDELRSLLADLRAAAIEPGQERWWEPALRHGIGLVGLAVGDSTLAQNQPEILTVMSDSAEAYHLAWALSQSLRARIALEQGQVQRALAFLERARWERVPAPSAAEVGDRYLRAGLLARLGRWDETERWYGSLAERSSRETVYLGPALYRLGRLHEQRGEAKRALACYERFTRLWARAESPRPHILLDALRRVERLKAGDSGSRPQSDLGRRMGKLGACGGSDSPG